MAGKGRIVVDAWRVRIRGFASDRPFEKHEVMCIHCWYYYVETGEVWHERPDEILEEIEFSPFLIHSDGDAPRRFVRRPRPSPAKDFEDSYAQQAMERIISGRRNSNGSLVDYF